MNARFVSAVVLSTLVGAVACASAPDASSPAESTAQTREAQVVAADPAPAQPAPIALPGQPAQPALPGPVMPPVDEQTIVCLQWVKDPVLTDADRRNCLMSVLGLTYGTAAAMGAACRAAVLPPALIACVGAAVALSATAISQLWSCYDQALGAKPLICAAQVLVSDDDCRVANDCAGNEYCDRVSGACTPKIPRGGQCDPKHPEKCGGGQCWVHLGPKPVCS